MDIARPARSSDVVSHQVTTTTKDAVIFQAGGITATAISMDPVHAASFPRRRDDQLEWFRQMRTMPHAYTKTDKSSSSSTLHWNAGHAANA